MIELPPGLHGAFRRTDLVARLGLPAVHQLVRDGLLVRYSRNVLTDRRRTLEFPTRAAAALLHVGPRSALTSHTAALVYGCTAADPATIHVLCAPERAVTARKGVVLHIDAIDEADVLELDGLRVLGLETVIADLLCTIDRPVALACADQPLAALDPPFRDAFRAELSRRLRTRTDLRATRGKVLLELASGLPNPPPKAPCSWPSTTPACRYPNSSTVSATSPAAQPNPRESDARARVFDAQAAEFDPPAPEFDARDRALTRGEP